LIDQGSQAQGGEVDLWTSRPLRFVMLPADPGKSRLAADSGLVDVLPWMLGAALEKQTSLELVNRELLSDILAEQELSAQLSTKSGQIALGQVLGARLLVQCEFGALQLAATPENFVITKVVDTETTRDASPDDRVKLTRPIMVDELASKLAAAVQTAVDNAYPLQGKLTKQNRGLYANIGADVGVEVGMRFAVSPKPDPTLLMPDRFVFVEGPVGLKRAGVRTEGFEPGDIPEEGWYIVHTGD
ncbi:MAG: hypothetical protein GY851_11375, partial [bacterium]|nr:hypothetical protein [bacterium]